MKKIISIVSKDIDIDKVETVCKNVDKIIKYAIIYHDKGDIVKHYHIVLKVEDNCFLKFNYYNLFTFLFDAISIDTNRKISMKDEIKYMLLNGKYTVEDIHTNINLDELLNS